MRYREETGIHGQPIWVPLDRIAPELIEAVIVAEDANFYRHSGVDWEGLREAARRDWKEKRLRRGGSTITQQLAKNLYLNPSKTLWRKLKELFITLRLERTLSKARILELYLNVVEWGRGIYGAEAAARHYFGKPASGLTIDEASWLAAILPSPIRYGKGSDSSYIEQRASRIARLVERRLGIRPDAEEPVEPPEPDDLPEEPMLDPPPSINPPAPEVTAARGNAP
jgi:monofunctional biosynthetic peptidoglycan transglycosylase